MDKLKHVKPLKEHEEDAINYIKEFYKYNSNINGSGGLDRYLDDYDGWLKKLENDRNCIPSEEKVPAETYFLVRESDNKIVGMINIRLCLNKRLSKFAGHIGYGIRPTERRKGYNKINLYLGLMEAQKIGLDKVMLDCDVENLGSSKTMEALGGKLERTEIDPYDGILTSVYWINVDESLEKYKDEYDNFIDKSYGNKVMK